MELESYWYQEERALASSQCYKSNFKVCQGKGIIIVFQIKNTRASASWVLKLQDRSGWSNNSTMLLRARQRKAKKRVIQSCNMLCAEQKQSCKEDALHTSKDAQWRKTQYCAHAVLGPKMQKRRKADTDAQVPVASPGLFLATSHRLLSHLIQLKRYVLQILCLLGSHTGIQNFKNFKLLNYLN